MSLHIRDYDLNSLLTAKAAVEIDLYIRGKYIDENKNLSSIEEIIKITQENSLEDPKNSVHSGSFPHFAFLHSLENYESLMHMPESILAIREKLFEYELLDIKSLPKKRLENLRDFMVKFSRQINAWRNYLHNPSHYRILAFPKEAIVSQPKPYKILGFPKESIV